MRYIFTVPVEDVQYLAMEKFGRKLNFYELEQVKKGVEFGLECWEDVVKYALSDLEINKAH
jgi:predicted P-loop ATPase/GTPase